MVLGDNCNFNIGRGIFPRCDLSLFFFVKGPADWFKVVDSRSFSKVQYRSIRFVNYVRNVFYRVLRLRIERFTFDQLSCRAYIYFKNVLNFSLNSLQSWGAAESRCFRLVR